MTMNIFLTISVFLVASIYPPPISPTPLDTTEAGTPVSIIKPIKPVTSHVEPIPAVAPVPTAPTPSPPPASPPASSECGDNEFAHYIYMHESGCRLNAVNSIGACGIGQALPCSKLSNICPNWENDYVCQNSFFSSYVSASYGGWGGAYQFWLSHSWY